VPTAAHVPAPTPLAVVPFERHGGLVFLPVRVNGGRPLSFALETGAAPSVIDRDVAAALGIASAGGNVVSGAGEGSAAYTVVPDAALELAGVVARDASLIAAPLRDLGRYAGHPVDGLLGLDFLRRFALVVDFEGRRVVVHDAATFAPGADELGARVPVSLSSGHAMLDASIVLDDGRFVDGRFALDTGASPSAVVAAPFVRQHGLVEAVGRTSIAPGRGIASESGMTLGRPAGLRVGPFTVAEPVCGLSADTVGAFASDRWAGVVGNGIWERFTLTLDLSREQVYLRPNAGFARRELADASGLTILAEGDELRLYRVSRVAPGSPAAEAGVREGDELVAVGGRPAPETSLTVLRERLQAAGRTAELALRRGEELVSVRLALRQQV